MKKAESVLKVFLLAFVVTLTASLATETTHAQQSLFDARDDSMVFLFQDLQARRVGDLLTVIVSENTDVNNQDQRKGKKSTSEKSAFNMKYALGGIFGNSAADANASQSADSNREFDGDSQFSSDRSFSDRFTVQVIDVVNGNMIVFGTRKVNVEGDIRVLTLSGIIRPYDISSDNSVSSRLVGNLKMEYQGDGPEKAFTKQGWLGRRFNKAWPF